MARRGATSLSHEHPAWGRVESDGFTKMDHLRNEFGRPHMVTHLFDTAEECVELVKGLHGMNYILHQVIADADILFSWSRSFSREFEVDKREDRKEALRFRLAKPERISAPDA